MIPEDKFEQIASCVIDEWSWKIKSYSIHGYNITLHVKYNHRDSTYNAYLGFDSEGNFLTLNNPYDATGPGAIGYEIERRLK